MITADALSKRYHGTAVVDEVSFGCDPGTVTGFLGPNGAGKSTTLRMLTGLTRPDGGAATVAGQPFAALPNPARVAGTLLDASAVHPGRTGRATLRLAADLVGVPRSRVEDLLRLVGLDHAAARRRVGEYSLGMRQRLGVAQALLGDPTVLILDEPANGLDPEGIAWMRGLLRDFADRGGTVLLSSHLLAEVEAIADRLVIIDRGRIVANGALADLLAASGVLVRATDPVGLARVLGDAGLPFAVHPDGSVTVEPTDGGGGTSGLTERVARAAAAAGVIVLELRPAGGAGLERLFFDLTTTTTTTTTTATTAEATR
jgi:ABC-2 type transport system ATP-binding protein